MKVGLVTTYGSHCGIAVYSQDLADALLRLGIEVTIFGEKDNHAQTAHPVSKSWSRMEASLQLLKKDICERRPDIVHIQYADSMYKSPTAVLELLEGLERFPTVITLHYSKSQTFIEQLRRRSDAVVVHSEALINLKRAWSIDARQSIHVIPHGCDIQPPDTGRIRPRRAYGYTGNPLIGCHGFWHSYKNFTDLITLLFRMRRQYPDVQLVLLTPIHNDQQCSLRALNQFREEAAAMDLEKNIIVHTGFLPRTEIIHRFQACDVLVKPYGFGKHSIGVSGSILTMMLANRPVITRNPEQPISNFVYEFDDVLQGRSSLIGIICTLVEHPETAKKKLRESQTFLRECSWEKVAESYASVYKSILSLQSGA